MAKMTIEQRDRETRMKLLELREQEALSELEELGFHVTIHDMPRYVEADELLGTAGGFRRGDCWAVLYGRDGRRKNVSGSSALDALQQASAWCHWQSTLSDDAANKFHRSVGNEITPEAVITRRVAGDTATTALRRQGNVRAIVAFADDGTARVVDAHGTPINGDITQASMHSEAVNEGTIR